MNNKEIVGKEAPMSLAVQLYWIRKKKCPLVPRAQVATTMKLTNSLVAASLAIITIIYYMAFGNPRKTIWDAFRWLYTNCGMYKVTSAGLKISALINKFKSQEKKEEAPEELELCLSEQMDQDAEERGAASRRGAAMDHRQKSDQISPETPVKARSPPHAPQTGMLAVYQKMNEHLGKKRTTFSETV